MICYAQAIVCSLLYCELDSKNSIFDTEMLILPEGFQRRLCITFWKYVVFLRPCTKRNNYVINPMQKGKFLLFLWFQKEMLLLEGLPDDTKYYSNHYIFYCDWEVDYYKKRVADRSSAKKETAPYFHVVPINCKPVVTPLNPFKLRRLLFINELHYESFHFENYVENIIFFWISNRALLV